MHDRLRQLTTRLAPSPTGGLHVGHARTFLIAWLAARSVGGRVILRIEDLDSSRIRPGATEQAMIDLRWIGLNWDEGPDVGGPNSPYIQSERKQSYEAALDRLKAKELVYPCTCTRAEIARAASAPHAAEEGPRYPGTCSHRGVADAKKQADRPYCWRFRVPEGTITWDDRVRGRISSDPSAEGGDFVVGRSSGEPAYQLAVVCDDAAMQVNLVIRGDDLIPSTPRQILLFRALEWPAPEYGHVPLVLAEDGRRLAKRDDSIKLGSLREAGLDPGELVAEVARGCGMNCLQSHVMPEGLLELFNLSKIPRDSWIYHHRPVQGSRDP